MEDSKVDFSQRTQDPNCDADSQCTASQSRSDFEGSSPFREDSPSFRREDVPIAFGGLSTQAGTPLNPSQARAAASIFEPEPDFHNPEMPANFRVHHNRDVIPGCLVQLMWYDNSEMDMDGSEVDSDDEMSDDEELRGDGMQGKGHDAVQIHVYTPDELSNASYMPEHHAIIHSGRRVPPLQTGEKRSENPPIRVEGMEELAMESRVNYTKVFTIEHTFPLAFVGKISPSHWPAFSSSFATVYSRVRGWNMQPPSAEPELDSDCPDSDCPDCQPLSDGTEPLPVSSNTYQSPPYNVREYTYSGSDIPHGALRGDSESKHLESSPSGIQVPTSPATDANTASPSASTRDPT